MWKATSGYWDEWDDRLLEIIPDYLFEFESYEGSDFDNLSPDEYDYFVSLFKGLPEDFNSLLLKQAVYCYEPIPDRGAEASKIVMEACNILEQNEIPLPDIDTVTFSLFSEKYGWGDNFDGAEISTIL